MKSLYGQHRLSLQLSTRTTNLSTNRGELRVLIDFSFKMASCRPDDTEDSIRVYTTDTIVDNPGAKIVYKGLIICASNALYHTKRNPEFSAKMKEAEANPKDKKIRADILAMMTEGNTDRNWLPLSPR